MKNKYLILCIYFVVLCSNAQSTIFNLDGSEPIPSSWQGINNIEDYAIERVDYYLLEAGNPSDYILSSAYDLSNYLFGEFQVNFRSFGGGSQSRLKVEISYDNGATFSQEVISNLSTTTYQSMTIPLNMVSNAVVFKWSNNEIDGRGIRMQNLILTASQNPSFFITITNPDNNAVFPAGTSEVLLSYTSSESSLLNVMINGVLYSGNTQSPISIPTISGESYAVTLTISNGTSLSETVLFSIEEGCTTPVGAIIINEIMFNPSQVSDANGEYFELYNTTDEVVELEGWQIKDLSAPNEFFTINESVEIVPNSYIVLAKNGDLNINGGFTADYVYPSNFNLSNSADEIGLYCNDTLIDSVQWDTTFDSLAGASIALDPSSQSYTANDLAVNWNSSLSIFGNGDFGTPGTINDSVLSVDNIFITTFTIYPNPNNGKEISIISASGKEKKVTLFNSVGQLLLEAKTFKNITLPNIAKGSYLLKVTEEDKTEIQRLIIY